MENLYKPLMTLLHTNFNHVPFLYNKFSQYLKLISDWAKNSCTAAATGSCPDMVTSTLAILNFIRAGSRLEFTWVYYSFLCRKSHRKSLKNWWSVYKLYGTLILYMWSTFILALA